MRDLPLNALRAFALVWRCGGIRPAARELGVTHSAVSRYVKELEAWLGHPLTHQSAGRRALAFTAEGAALGRRVLESLEEINTASNAVRERRSPNSVVISTTPSFAARWLLPRLPALAEAHPNLEVSVLAEQRLIDMKDGEADLAIRMGKGPWPDLDAEPLMDDWLYPVMGRKLWREAGMPNKPEEIASLPLLHDRDPQTSWLLWQKSHGPKGLDIQSGQRFSSSDLALQAAAQNQGITLARHQLAQRDVGNGLLIRPCGEQAIKLPNAYWIVTPKHRPLKRATQTVIKWLKKASASTDG